jgi:hypothetical protein
MRAWRQDGPLGVFFAVVNHIRTPLQHDLYEDFQRSANKGLPDDTKAQIKEPVKPVTEHQLFEVAERSKFINFSTLSISNLPS